MSDRTTEDTLDQLRIWLVTKIHEAHGHFIDAREGSCDEAYWDGCADAYDAVRKWLYEEAERENPKEETDVDR